MWLILPTSRSSPASEDSTSPSDSRFQDLAQFVTWKTTSRSATFWRRVWRKGRLKPFLSGVTCEPSHANSIVAEWLESSAGSPARISLSPENEPASTTEKRADSGGNTSELSEKSDPHGSSSKTSPASCAAPVAIWNPETQRMESPQIGLFATSMPFSGRWPISGSIRSGCVYERPTWAPPRSGSGCSSWPTAQAHDCRGAKTPEQIQTMRESTGAGVRNLNEVAANWQTPATDSFRSRGGDRKQEMGLDQQARRWSTPRGEDAESCGLHPGAEDSLTGQTRGWITPHGNLNPTSGAGGGEFAKQVQNWATPRSRDWKGGDRKQEMGLDQQAWRWRTPQATDAKNVGDRIHSEQIMLTQQAANWATPRTISGGGESTQRKAELGRTESGGGDLQAQTQSFSLPVQAWVEKACSLTYETFVLAALAELGNAIKPNSVTPSDGPKSSNEIRNSRPRLNPAFDAWLMGFPWWWTRTAPTSFGPAATQSWFCRLRLRLEFLLGDSGMTHE